MTPALAAMVAIMGASLFEVNSVPLELPPQAQGFVEAKCFFANADGDAVVDLFIAQGNTITALSSAAGIREAVLPAGTSAYDVADIDADGKPEIIAAQGRAVIRISLALPGDANEPTKLFEADSLYGRAVPVPTPAVMAAPLDSTGALGIALPGNEGIALCRVDGTPVSTGPYSVVENDVHALFPERDGADGGLSLTMALQTTFAPSMQSEGGSSMTGSGRATTAGALRTAAGDEPVNWPWFVVRNEKAKSTRAYCAVEESLNTLIRMCDVAVDADGAPGSIAAPGPERRYPGAMIPIGDAAPDFNGDGYADLLLWNAPRPGISVDALLRAVVGRNWPMTLTVHLYSPDKGRFEPMSATELVYRVPVTWFLTGGVPLRNYVLADFNGDKKTDLAMCTAENEYSVWLYTGGFAATPDETHTFTENITGVELTGDTAGNGKTSIVLRSDGHVYALFAK